MGERPKDWALWIPLVELWYNTTKHSSNQCTPFEPLYGFLPPKLTNYLPKSSPIEAVDASLQSREHIKYFLAKNLRKAQDSMRKYAVSKRVRGNLKYKT